jgi:hypothetical protein
VVGGAVPASVSPGDVSALVGGAGNVPASSVSTSVPGVFSRIVLQPRKAIARTLAVVTKLNEVRGVRMFRTLR